MCNNVFELVGSPYKFFTVLNLAVDPNYDDGEKRLPSWVYWVMGVLVLAAAFGTVVGDLTYSNGVITWDNYGAARGFMWGACVRGCMIGLALGLGQTIIEELIELLCTTRLS